MYDVRRRQRALLIAVALLPACASFSARPELPTYAGPSEPVEVRIVMSESAFQQVGPDDWIHIPSDGFMAEMSVDAIRRSGWVRQVEPETPAADLRLRVASYRGPGPALLPLLTAFLIPDLVDHRVEVTLEFWDQSGQFSHCVRAADTRTWYQTLLILAYPFRSPAHGRIKTSEALALSCMAEILSAPVGHP